LAFVGRIVGLALDGGAAMMDHKTKAALVSRLAEFAPDSWLLWDWFLIQPGGDQRRHGSSTRTQITA
jgi:hypothetical protein